MQCLWLVTILIKLAWTANCWEKPSRTIGEEIVKSLHVFLHARIHTFQTSPTQVLDTSQDQFKTAKSCLHNYQHFYKEALK